MRPNVYKYYMKDGSCRFFYKISINGHQILKRGFKTELDAFKDLSFVLSKEDNYEDIKNLKYYEVCELYKNHLKETLKITYYHKRCSTIDNYLKKYIRNVPLCKLSQYDFDKFRSKIKNTYLKDKNEIILFLQRMFKWIEEYYGYRVSYAFRINRIRDDTVSYAIKEDKKQYVTFELFLSYYYHLDPYYKLLILTLFIFGLRISELRALKVNSLKDGYLYVLAEATAKTGLGKTVILTTKSSTSNRRLLVPEEYLGLLNSHIKKYKLKKNDFIFFSSVGDKINKKYPVGEETIRRHLRTCEKIYKLDHIHPHMFRHSNVTILKSNGYDLSDIEKYVGHSDVNITKDYYYHLPIEKENDVKNTLNGLIKDIKRYE